MTNILDLVARILISALFLLNGVFKINNYDGTVDWMEGFGIPGILLIPAIILEIVGPILIILGYKAKIAAGLLRIAIIMIVAVITILNDRSRRESRICRRSREGPPPPQLKAQTLAMAVAIVGISSILNIRIDSRGNCL